MQLQNDQESQGKDRKERTFIIYEQNMSQFAHCVLNGSLTHTTYMQAPSSLSCSAFPSSPDMYFFVAATLCAWCMCMYVCTICTMYGTGFLSPLCSTLCSEQWVQTQQCTYVYMQVCKVEKRTKPMHLTQIPQLLLQAGHTQLGHVGLNNPNVN